MSEKLTAMFLKTFRLKNFKAIRDSGVVTFTPLTALIGYNGSGKSSLIEGLQTYQHIVTQGLDEAMHRWRGFEYIHNPPEKVSFFGSSRTDVEPISFELTGSAWVQDDYLIDMQVAIMPTNFVLIKSEQVGFHSIDFASRDSGGAIKFSGVSDADLHMPRLQGNVSALVNYYVDAYFGVPGVVADSVNEITAMQHLSRSIPSWHFVNLNPYVMAQPKIQTRSSEQIILNEDGSNIAEYLLDIRQRDEGAFMGIVEALRQVLPYADSLQPTLTTELGRSVHLQLTEGEMVIPGWLLSTGTLRVVALLALLRHPNPPPLIVIDEIENGLDPRTLNFLVEEMRNTVESGASQIILTTHSPYLLDLLSLSQIVLVERTQSGETVFTRPADDKSLREWSTRFAPGMLYTSGRLSTLA